MLKWEQVAAGRVHTLTLLLTTAATLQLVFRHLLILLTPMLRYLPSALREVILVSIPHRSHQQEQQPLPTTVPALRLSPHLLSALKLAPAQADPALILTRLLTTAATLQPAFRHLLISSVRQLRHSHSVLRDLRSVAILLHSLQQERQRLLMFAQVLLS